MKSTDRLTKKVNKWLSFPKLNPDARLRLFCFPYAGGGAHIFFPWQDKLSTWIEVCAIQLPGRGMRFTDKPFTHHKQIVNELLENMSDYLDKPYALFGHSMGALLAYELAQEIQKRGMSQASPLFVSGRRAMHINSQAKAIYDLPEQDLMTELRKLNGTPVEVLDNKELMSLVLPVIRADFELCDTYTYNEHYDKLAINITAFEGSDDNKANGDSVLAWKELTSGHFQSKKLKGDHFFIHSSEQQLLTSLNNELSGHIKSQTQRFAS